MSEQSQKVEAGKDQYIFVYRTYQPITIKGKVQFTTKEGTILLQDTFDIDFPATAENPCHMLTACLVRIQQVMTLI